MTPTSFIIYARPTEYRRQVAGVPWDCFGFGPAGTARSVPSASADSWSAIIGLYPYHGNQQRGCNRYRACISKGHQTLCQMSSMPS